MEKTKPEGHHYGARSMTIKMKIKDLVLTIAGILVGCTHRPLIPGDEE
jgi:hypothetical protein